MSQIIDIAVNLTDEQFQGIYRGKQVHSADVSEMLARAKGKGVESIIITGTSLSESRAALEMANKYAQYSTVGCHPTSTSEIDAHPGGVIAYLQELEDLIVQDRQQGKRMVALGEIGLDYDRLHHSPKETQLKHFPALLALGEKHNLPLFLHSRHPDAHVDFVRILRDAGWTGGKRDGQGERGRSGVVHSFTGTKEEMEELIDYGLYIGLNGCSLKTPENLAVVKEVPLDRLMLETDAPWCSITSTAASHSLLPPDTHPSAVLKSVKDKTYKPTTHSEQAVKGRNEPGNIAAVAYVVAQVKGVGVEEVLEAALVNTKRIFHLI